MFRKILQRKENQVALGCITVQGKKITNLKSLGNKHSPGLTKAGRLSFSGFLGSKKVKVYSAFSLQQIELNRAIRHVQYGTLNFPKIVAYDDTLIAEEWVSGQSLKELDEKAVDEAAAVISRFLQDCKVAEALQKLAVDHSDAFCYIEDYLLARIGTWQHLDIIQDFIESWKKDYLLNKGKLTSRLTHPDLSLANIIKEDTTGKYFIIDNELLGVGPGWILDWHNSFLRRKENSSHIYQGEVDNIFLEKTWRLRLLGSALMAGNVHKAVELLESN